MMAAYRCDELPRKPPALDSGLFRLDSLRPEDAFVTPGGYEGVVSAEVRSDGRIGVLVPAISKDAIYVPGETLVRPVPRRGAA